jgi:hypothetical protein
LSALPPPWTKTRRLLHKIMVSETMGKARTIRTGVRITVIKVSFYSFAMCSSICHERFTVTNAS